MEPIIYLKAQSLFDRHIDDKTIRQALKESGVDGRRFSRFTHLALLGILPLKTQIPPESALFLASTFNSPSKFDKMFYALMNENLPSPLDFMANLGNAAVFQIAQSLQLKGTSLFLAVEAETLWQPLWLAYQELISGTVRTAVVGWAYECVSENDVRCEGSQWLLLSTQPEKAIDSFNLSGLKEFKPKILT